MAIQIQMRRGTAAQWTSSNPTLAVGELGVETDTNKLKVGDGTTAWNSLGYTTPSLDVADLGDVTITSVTSGEALVWNGTAWVNSDLTSTITASIVDSAPATLDTLNELAAALGDDPNFATTVSNSIAGKADTSHTHSLTDVTDVTASAAELNVLDGVTATTTELNYTDGVTSGIQTQLDGKAATSHTHTVSNITDLTATAAEINKLDGVTATTTELNYTDGVTSSIQTQLNGKANLSGATFSGRVTASDSTEARFSVRNIYISTGDPTGGTDGDVWLKYE